tara:strand:+ start:918 stop:1547 length:630 start_codon:yes stop_codon:yes gene_type:complete
MKLYSYWRSTTSYRVRIALHMKSIAHEIIPVDLVKGEHRNATCQLINPAKGVPILILEDGSVLTQSLAILRYLDKTYPDPPLLPENPFDAAQVEATSLIIATDIHPVNNLKVTNKFRELGHSQEAVVSWMKHWMREGLFAFTTLLRDGPFCFGSHPSLADICLIPQLYNARRWGADLSELGRLIEIEQNCLQLESFQLAEPDRQIDAKK